MIHNHNIFSYSQGEKRAAGNMIPFPAILLLVCLCGQSRIIDNLRSGTSFSVKKNEPRAASLLTIYLVLRFSDTIRESTRNMNRDRTYQVSGAYQLGTDVVSPRAASE